jgi:serine phosphatase RsbU (regulator of sigma subunit)
MTYYKEDSEMQTKQAKKLNSMRGKFIIFSVILLMILFLSGGMSFLLLMERMQFDIAEEQLKQVVEFERLKLEVSANAELAIALKMADSPLIKQYFSNPGDFELQKSAIEEIEAYQRAFVSNSVFWAKEYDRIYRHDGNALYTLCPDNWENRWYFFTLHETGVYNFNVNYDPGLNVTNLWINVPVFDENGSPLGVVGTGKSISGFIDDVYHNYHGNAHMYFFNNLGEITGAQNVEYVKNKINIAAKLGQVGEDILSAVNKLDSNKVISFETNNRSGLVVIGSIPAFDWYIVAIQDFGVEDILSSGMTILFAVIMLVIIAVVVIFNIFAVKLLRGSELAKNQAVEARESIEASINYAGKIQTNLLPKDSVFERAFKDYSVIWEPRDVVGGDIYWAKNFTEGTVLCVCDCTGHGTPGALLTMLAVSAFESFITNYNCNDPSRFIYLIDEKLSTALNSKNMRSNARNSSIMDIDDGCDLAVLFIAKNGDVIMSAGNINVFVCDGKTVKRYKGQPILIGEGRLLGEEDIKTITIEYNPDYKFYIATDGLFDQVGEIDNRKKQFGYKTLEQIILENHNEEQSVISSKIWDAFKQHQGEEIRRDDVELITFKPKREGI